MKPFACLTRSGPLTSDLVAFSEPELGAHLSCYDGREESMPCSEHSQSFCLLWEPEGMVQDKGAVVGGALDTLAAMHAAGARSKRKILSLCEFRPYGDG